jgi:hypothetical protein
MKSLFKGMLLVACYLATTLFANAGVNILETYTDNIVIQPDRVVHFYGPYWKNKGQYPYYITAVQIRTASENGTNAIVSVLKYNNDNYELSYFGGFVGPGAAYPAEPPVYFAPNYVAVNPGDSIGIYVLNGGQSPLSVFIVIWYSYEEP